MHKRIFASLHNFLEDGHVLGRNVVCKSFLQALFRLDPFDEYAFFLHAPKAMDNQLEQLTELSALKRAAVHIYPRQHFVSGMLSEDLYCLHLADPVSDQPQAAFLRNRFSRRLFPITSVPHSLNYLNYPSAFLQQIWPGACSRDIICASSRAAQAVLSGYFSMLRDNYKLPDDWHEPEIRLLPLGIDCQRFAPADENGRKRARQKLGIPEKSVCCLCHGRLAVDDKMDLLPLLYAARRVLDEDQAPDLHILISGRHREHDNYPEVLDTVAKNLKIPLTLLLDPNAQAMHEAFACADFFLSISDNVQETFGLTLLEAGASGLACIASDWDGYRDIIDDQQSGWLIPTVAPRDTPRLNALAYGLPENIHELLRAQQTVIDVPSLANAISRLARDPALRNAMGACARKRMLTHFDWSVIVEAWLKILEEAYAAKITPFEQARLATAEHPAFLNFAQLFTRHPSYCPHTAELGQKEIRLSTRGLKVLQKKALPVTWNNLELCLQGLDIRKLLVLARHPISIAKLLSRLCETKISQESGQFAVLWALKHDLLEFASNETHKKK